MLVFSLLVALLAYVVSAQDCSGVCKSYGLDFVDGGNYYQNSASTANFTALQDFSGCQSDLADNILVDPQGDQYLCNSTPLTPDGTQQQIIWSVFSKRMTNEEPLTDRSPIAKDQLTSGEYSIIVLSNNGQCAPINYIRSFQLDVAPQVTSKIPLTVIITSTSAPVTSTTVVATESITTTALTVTSTVSGAYAATRTVTPWPALALTTRGLISLTQTRLTATVVATTTRTRACPTTTATARVADLVNLRIAITIPGLHATVGILLPRETGSPATQTEPLARPTARSGSIEHKQVPADSRDVLLPRAGALQKRGPDYPTITVQDSAVGITTSTVITTAPLTTVSVTSLVLTTVSVISTATYNANALKTITITQPTKTNTLTLWVPLAVVMRTSTQRITAVVTQAPTNC